MHTGLTQAKEPLNCLIWKRVDERQTRERLMATALGTKKSQHADRTEGVVPGRVTAHSDIMVIQITVGDE
jgi:hypothetical protein